MKNQEPPPSASDYNILLPCTPETFADFVSKLLGSAQTIERRFMGCFELSSKDIENTFYLVQQRVSQQNEASLVEFKVKIIYEDNSSVLLNDLTDFLHYSEVRPIASKGVHLTWVYLIRFQDKQALEKQQIDLTFHAGHTSYPDDVDSYPVISVFHRGHIQLRIAHTARTWGVDLESLLAGHIESLLKGEPPLKRFIYRHSGKIGLVAGLVTFMGVAIGAYVATGRFAAQQIEKARGVTTLGLADKIDFVIERFAEGAWTQFNLLTTAIMLGGVIVSVALGAWVTAAADNRPPSFVLLSKKAEEDRKKEMKRRQRGWVIFFLSIAMSIVTGFIANAVFALALRLFQ